MIRIFTALALSVALVSCSGNESARRVDTASSLTVAFYNLENLFDPADDPSMTGDDEFTPTGKNGWTQERLDRKLEAIARVIRAMDAYGGADIVGLCEMENRAVLDRLVGEFLPKGQYAVVHEDSEDERGIDVALIYRPAAVSVRGHRLHRIDLGDDRTRQILSVSLEREGKPFTVMVNHWPSRSGGEEKSEPKRIEAARTAARVIDSLYAIDASADIILMGDLNDEPTNRSLVDVLDASAYSGAAFNDRMINLAAPVAEADTIGSYFYRGQWETIDQILLSRGALDNRGLVMIETSQSVFTPEFIRDEKADRTARPAYRTYKGSQYIGGVSDHFPVIVRVGWN
jgi:predicted extracellular nuclease